MFSPNPKNDPLLAAIKGVIAENDKHREAVDRANKHFKIADKRQLPHNLHADYDKMLSESTIISEKITKSTPMGDVIRDFEKSDAPQFEGKSKEKRRQMAIAAKMAMNEALKGNQDKIDANKNNRIDAQDFKMLRNKNMTAEDIMREAIANIAEKDTLSEAEYNILMELDVSDIDVMNSDLYKNAVKSVKDPRRIQIGQDIEGLDKFEKGDTIFSRVKLALAAQKAADRMPTRPAPVPLPRPADRMPTGTTFDPTDPLGGPDPFTPYGEPLPGLDPSRFTPYPRVPATSAPWTSDNFQMAAIRNAEQPQFRVGTGPDGNRLTPNAFGYGTNGVTGQPPAPAPVPLPRPATRPAPVPLPRPADRMNEESQYSVRKGDTLSAIAKRNNTTVDAIAKASGISDLNKLSIGQKIVIPGKMVAPVPLPRPDSRRPVQQEPAAVTMRPSVASTSGIGAEVRPSVQDRPVQQEPTAVTMRPSVASTSGIGAEVRPSVQDRPVQQEPAAVTMRPSVASTSGIGAEVRPDSRRPVQQEPAAVTMRPSVASTSGVNARLTPNTQAADDDGSGPTPTYVAPEIKMATGNKSTLFPNRPKTTVDQYVKSLPSPDLDTATGLLNWMNTKQSVKADQDQQLADRLAQADMETSKQPKTTVDQYVKSLPSPDLKTSVGLENWLNKMRR